MQIDFLIDGFNLYHSIKNADVDMGHGCSRWLDLRKLLRSFLPGMGREYRIGNIYYFTAIAYHKERTSEGSVQRHLDYLRVLKSQDIHVVKGNFQKSNKQYVDTEGNKRYLREEKMTDVAIACQWLESLMSKECNGIALMSGDTDFLPVIDTGKRLFPDKKVFILFPYKRKNDAIEKAVGPSRCFKAKQATYSKFQYDPIIYDKRKRPISIPGKWKC